MITFKKNVLYFVLFSFVLVNEMLNGKMDELSSKYFLKMHMLLIKMYDDSINNDTRFMYITEYTLRSSMLNVNSPVCIRKTQDRSSDSIATLAI